MKHICSIYLAITFALATQVAFGQAPDTIPQGETKNTPYKTIVTDRINQAEDQERGPSLSKILETANESFEKKYFYAAMKYYSFVLASEPLQVEALRGYGESAWEIAALDSAESAFQRMVDHGVNIAPDYFPKMKLADVKYRKGNYDEAFVLYDELATVPQTVPLPDTLKAKAAAQRELCEWAQEGGRENLYSVKEGSYTMLDTTVNTREFAEYAANYHEGQLYFSAYRYEFEKDRANPNRNLIKLLTAKEMDEMTLVNESEINDRKRHHTAHASFNGKGDAVYFAMGDFVGRTAEIRFDLYRRKKQPDGSWGLPEKLDRVNSAAFTTTEPSVGKLPGDAFETLFFVTDRPDGRGNGDRDIWYSRIIGDSLTNPQPLNELNTVDDDVTPFFHSPSGNLFFSTDGRRSLGGFDIYKSKREKGHWMSPQHLGAPINSSANDVFFILDDESGKAYFSNNRRGSSNNSEEGCCYDIYSVEFLTKYKAVGIHALTNNALPFTKITLYERGPKGELIPIANPEADATSSYAFDVKLGKEYVFIGEKDDFIPDTLVFKTPNELWLGEKVDSLYLQPKFQVVALVFDADTGEPLNGSTTTFFNLGTQDKTGNFVPSNAPGTVDVLPESSNRQEYKLEVNHKYRILAAKEGYVANTSKADSSEVISTVGKLMGFKDTVRLYLHRPSVLETYLPITLYFDNDYPKRIRATDPQLENVTDPFLVEMKHALEKNPKDPTYHDTILIDYQKTFVGYIREKDNYKIGFSQGLPASQVQTAKDTIENFFENEVRFNWNRFFDFSDRIDSMLQRGDTIILTLKGYASPLSNPEYNKHLTNRRIASVYNHFMIFDGGIFTKYREEFGTNQLRFIREANGDEESVKMGISGNPKDRRSSVYDVQASRARRVQIVGARVSKGGTVKKGF